jgi:hypothetical protein
VLVTCGRLAARRSHSRAVPSSLNTQQSEEKLPLQHQVNWQGSHLPVTNKSPRRAGQTLFTNDSWPVTFLMRCPVSESQTAAVESAEAEKIFSAGHT